MSCCVLFDCLLLLRRDNKRAGRRQLEVGMFGQQPLGQFIHGQGDEVLFGDRLVGGGGQPEPGGFHARIRHGGERTGGAAFRQEDRFPLGAFRAGHAPAVGQAEAARLCGFDGAGHIALFYFLFVRLRI